MKKSLISLICLFSALLLVLSGCSSDNAPEGYKNVANENDSFYLYVPSAWVSNTSGGTASAYYASNDFSNVSFTCMVIEPDTMDDLVEYKTITHAELEAILPSFKEIPSEPKLDENGTEIAPPAIDGRDTIVFEYECTLGEDNYKYLQAVTMKDDFFYIFTYTALAENYDSHLEDVNGIIENIKFK